MSDDADPVSTEIATIEQGMRTDIGAYRADPAMQERYRGLIDARDGRAAAPAKPSAAVRERADIEKLLADRNSAYWKGPDAERLQRRYLALLSGDAAPSASSGNWRLSAAEARPNFAPALVEEWEASGGFAVRLAAAQDAIGAIVGGVARDDPELAQLLVSSFDVLRPGAQMAVFSELALPSPGYVVPAAQGEIERFASTPEGRNLTAWWGAARTPRNVGIIRERFARMLGRMDAASRSNFTHWFDNITPGEVQIIYHVATSGAR